MNFYYLNKRTKLIIICLMTIFFTSCLQEELENEPTIEEASFSSGNSNTTPNKYIEPDQVVVRYKNPTISDADKDVIRASYQELYKFQIVDIETCNCNIKDIELWTINMSTAGFTDIEDLIRGLQNNEGEGDMNGNPQFTITIRKSPEPWETRRDIGIESRIVSSNNPDAVNIAIIDTGIDYNYLNEPVLYNSGQNPTCDDELSGWDFVNNDNNPKDDHYHGTLVAKIIQNNLDRTEIPYHLLSLKAFNESGRGTYFNTVCAVRYVLEHEDIDVVNMSFGWNNVENTTIMQNMISELENTTLFVGSAGNDGEDTDILGNEHYPSGYETANLLTVAGYTGNTDPNGISMYVDQYGRIFGDVIADDSNFGETSIDIAAPFRFNLILTSADSIIDASGTVNGTSYSAAFTSSRSAQIKSANSNLTPLLLKSQTINSGFISVATRNKTRQNRVLTGSINSSGPRMNVPLN